MRQIMIGSIVTATVIGGLSLAGVGTAAASPADLHRPTGILDGSLNNADVASGSNVLGALVNSMLSDSSNNNANSGAAGQNNNAIND
jgi:hypothetical protein